MRLFTLEPAGYLGRALAARLAEHGHTVVGPPKDASLADIQAACVGADAAVLDLVSPGREAELTALLSHIGSYNFEGAGRAGFTVLGVSTVLTWNQSNKSSKKSSKESNWKLRKCSPRFKGVRLLETAVLSTARESAAAPVTAMVVASGILYGAGEHDLHHLFKAAWMHAGDASFPGLPLIGDGKNVIPTIHVHDLVSVVRLLLEAPPAEQSYFVAVDAGHTTQKALVTAIANGLGDGKIRNVERMDEKVLLAASNAAAGEYADEPSSTANAAAPAAADGAAPAAAAPAAAATAASSAASAALLSSSIAAANALTNGNPEIILADLKIEAEWLAGQPFEWVCEQGPASSPEVFESLLRAEFVKARNLRPVRVWVTGAPGAGKSHYSAALASKLYVPHIRLDNLLAQALGAKDEFAERIAQALVESANAKNAAAAGGGAKGKKKQQAKDKAAQLLALQSSGAQAAPGGKGKHGRTGSAASGKGGAGASAVPNGPVDLSLFDTDVPRLPSYLLVKVVKRALRSPLCRNKGFILDNFPRTAEEARWLFSPDVEEDPDTGAPLTQIEDKRAVALANAALAEDEGDDPAAAAGAEPPEPQPRDPTTMVDSVVFLGCSEGLASSRMKSLPASAVRPNHNDEEGFARRWARWQAIDAANGQGADAALAQQHNIHNPLFFVQESVEVLELPEGVAADTERGLDTVLAYVSKKGRPANYHPTEEEENAAKAAEQTKREEQERAAKEDARTKAQDESAQRARAATNASLRRAAVLLEDAALVEASAAPMRTYLLDNVIPALVDGLLDVAKNQPEDPVDALAEYLFNYSVDVPADKDNAQDRPKL